MDPRDDERRIAEAPRPALGRSGGRDPNSRSSAMKEEWEMSTVQHSSGSAIDVRTIAARERLPSNTSSSPSKISFLERSRSEAAVLSF